MQLTKRLILANAAAVIVPLAITALAALAYIYVFNGLLKKDLSFERYQRLLEIRFELDGNQQSILRRNPEIIEQPDFQSYLQKQMADIGGEILILKNNTVVTSSYNFTSIDVAKLNTDNYQRSGDYFYLENVAYNVETIPVPLTENDEGKVILLAPSNTPDSNFSDFFMFLCCIFFSSFLLTNIYISCQLSRTIINPLRNLQKVAAEISQGNLNREITEEGDKEIQELCHGLEIMRLKLKDLIHTQLKYEDNRKMLVSSISHDLKTPVTTIKGYIEGILDGVANTPEKKNKYLQTAYQKAIQVDQMIDDLLLYARLDLNQMPFNFEKTNIKNYLEEFIAESEPEMEQRNIGLNFNSELSGLKFSNLDREKMRRVLTNIFDNAVKYIDKPRGEIKVLLREISDRVIIEIRDNGTGINQQDLPYIFERFYRSDSSRGKIKGSGLGLAIAKQIVEGHGGRIWAVSHGKEGTSILISLRSESHEKNSDYRR